MSAKNFMSSVLDELMGRNRNALPDEQPKNVSWDDPEICTQYLVSFCPNELFVNTKADLGPCVKLHDDQLRKRYQDEAPNNRKLQFENEFIRFADKMIQDIEAKIKRGKIRIALANGPDGVYAGPGSKNAEKIAFLTDRINVLLKEAEEAGCGGDVEKAQGLLKLCDQLKEEREQMKSNEVNHPWNPDKAMQVCEVCGSYLIIGEAQHRLDDHIMGKQHMGFALLRKTMDDVKKARETREMEERERAEMERRERRFGGGGRERGIDRDRVDRDRHRRDKDRTDDKNSSRSRSRDRRKKDDKRTKSKSPRLRSRSRDRKDRKEKDERKRDRDSSRDRKSRKHSDDKDRDKDRKRSKRSRSRSRDKHRRRRSGSREKHKSRDKERKHKEESKDKDHKPTANDLNPEGTPSKSSKFQSPKLLIEHENTVRTSIQDDSSHAGKSYEGKSGEAEFQFKEALSSWHTDDVVDPFAGPVDTYELADEGVLSDQGDAV